MPTASGLVLRRADTIEPQRIGWLWPHRLPQAKLVVVAGEPGTAKSRFSLNVAATLSRGTAWPDGTGRCILGETVNASFEDDAGDTAVPRLIAEGADLSKIIFLETVRDDEGHVRPFDATQDVERLVILLRERPGVRLVVIDPIQSQAFSC